jgi:hypothetical protein
MSDEDDRSAEIEVNANPPKNPWSSWEEDTEIVTPEEVEPEKPVETKTEPGGLTREELQLEVEKLQSQISAVSTQPDSTAAAIRDLKESLAPQPQTQTETDAEFNERMKDKLIEDPMGVQMEIYRRKVEPTLNMMGGQLMKATRRLAEIQNPETFVRYASEIDREVQQMPYKDADSYQTAHDLVVARHLDELRSPEQDKIAELEKQIEELKTQSQTPATPSTPTPEYNPQGPSPTSSGRVIATNYQQAIAKDIAFKKFGTVDAYRRVINTANRLVADGQFKDLEEALGRMR